MKLGIVLATRADLPTAAALDSPVPWELPLHYVGPLQSTADDEDVPELPPRFVLVSFTTTWQRQVDVLQRTIDALEPLDRAVVVTTAGGEQEIVLHKSMSGHFEANVGVEGKTIHMLVDTGASSVVLANADAAEIGIDTANLRYTVPVMTANGRTAAAPVTLSEISIGPIMRRNIPALVAQDGQLGQSLLGMSFLSTLGSLQMQTDELRLRDR